MCKSTPAPGWMMARLFLATVTKWGTVPAFAMFKYKQGLAVCLSRSSSCRCRSPPFLELRPSRAPSAGPWTCAVAKGIGGENDGIEFR
jgi:hypothetical protein